MKVLSHYTLLADLFRYPSRSMSVDVARCMRQIEKFYPEAVPELEKFVEFIQNTPPSEVEEVFTKTFHIQAICYLDIGYMIFGEDYKRGEFLVNMKKEQFKAGNDCGLELPDNLSNVLTLIPKIKDKDFRDELCVRIMIHAVKKMLDEFASSRMEMKNSVLKRQHNAILQENQVNGNIYQYPLRALLKILEEDFQGIAYKQEQNMIMEKSRQFIGKSAESLCNSCFPSVSLNNKTL